SVAGAIFDSNWMMRKPADYISLNNNPLSIDLRALVHIPDPQLRDAVLSAVSASVSVRHCLPNRALEMEVSDPLSVSRVARYLTPRLPPLQLSLLLRVKHHPSHYSIESSPSAPLSATSSLTDVEKGLGSGISTVDEKLNSATSTPGELPTLHLKPTSDISPISTLVPSSTASSPGEGPDSLEFEPAARKVLDEQPLKLILSPPPVPRISNEQTRTTRTDEEDPQRTHQNV
ncbi:10184_t:CDS:2, partial [Acaulospora colombiana]